MAPETGLERYREAAVLPAGEARSLPFSVYRDPGIFDLEMERIFRSDWVAVCAEAALAEPGDTLGIAVGGEPVALVRGADGRLRALSNTCRHRGTLLLDPGVGRLDGRHLVCPYHAWSYSDSGEFLGAPYSRGVTIEREAHCLPSFRVEVWMGVVFVCLDEAAPSLAERLAGIPEHLAEFAMEGFTEAAPIAEAEVWDANWKLIVENGMESYHLFRVHEKTLEKVTPTRGAYYLEGSAPWTLTGGAVVQRSGFFGKVLGAAFGYDDGTDGGSGGDHYTLVSVPPSFVGIVTGDSWDWIAAHPLSPTSTRVFTGSLTRAKPDFLTRAFSQSYATAFLEEDRKICERGQQGMAARAASGGRLVPLERVVVDFHHYLAWRLFGEEPPPRHTETRRS